MIDRVQGLAVTVGVVLLAVVLELVRRRKLLEEYAFVWIAAALLLLGLSVRPEFIRQVAEWFGVRNLPVVLVLLQVGLVFVTALSFSVIVSRQRRQIERLIEDTAVLAAEVRQLRAEQRGEVDAGDQAAASGSPNRPRR